MGIKIEAIEEKRVFDIYLGTMGVGRVSVETTDDDLPCLAEYDDSQGLLIELGWFKTVKQAGQALIRRHCGEGDVDEVKRIKAP